MYHQILVHNSTKKFQNNNEKKFQSLSKTRTVTLCSATSLDNHTYIEMPATLSPGLDERPATLPSHQDVSHEGVDF
jgi:hypothetical protein